VKAANYIGKLIYTCANIHRLERGRGSFGTRGRGGPEGEQADPGLPGKWPLNHHHTTTVLRPFFRDHLGETVPEENFWTLWCKGRLQRQAGRHSICTNQCPPPPIPHFLQAGCPFCCPTYSVKAQKAPSALNRSIINFLTRHSVPREGKNYAMQRKMLR